MTLTTYSFDGPDLREGRITSHTVDGVTVTFQTPTAVFRPAMPTERGPWALWNIGQNEEDGWRSPVIIRLSRLMRRARVSVGLNTRDWSRSTVTATLTAYDAAGTALTSASVGLGTGPTPITVPLEVRTPGDSIAMVSLSYNGNNAEVFDELVLESSSDAPVPPDAIPPIVRILSPGNGQTVNDPVVWVTGEVVEVSAVTVTLNGVPTPVRRTAPTRWEFAAWATLTGYGTVVAEATDEGGLTDDDTKTLIVRVPQRFQVSDVRFTQTGLFGPGTDPLQSRRIAGKTALFRLRLEVRTAEGTPAFVDGASVHILGGRRDTAFSGQPSPYDGSQFALGNPAWPLGDGTAYFFLPGRDIEPGYRYRFVLRLYVRGRVVHEQALADGWQFTDVRGLSLLIVPQHRPLDATLTAALLRTLNEMARMFPVPDGAVNLTGERGGGIRFAVLPPTDYQDHLDPADAIWQNREIPFEQGFLMRNHRVEADPGPDDTWNTGDEMVVDQTGEYLPINFMGAEDADRDGRFDQEERARAPGRAGHTPAVQRWENWGRFVRADAATRLLGWNIQQPSHAPERVARRAVATITARFDGKQNRTVLAGNAGPGEVSFWGDVDADANGFIPHEVGHSYRISLTRGMHTDNSTDPITNRDNRCAIQGEAVNLLSRRVVASPATLMCATVGGTSDLFLLPSEYDFLFDRFSSRGWVVA